MLETKSLTKIYNNGSGSIVALDKVTLNFEKGYIYGVVGHNGAGKTTLIKLLCGLVFPTSGHVFIDKEPLYPNNFKLLRKIGAILEGSRNIFWNLTPLQNMRYFSLLRGLSFKSVYPKIENYFDLFDLREKMNVPVRNLSQGMKQKIAIIVSLLHDPDILLLDEPTLGLDPASSNSMQRLIGEIALREKKVVIITSHQLNIIERLSHRLVYLKKGVVKFFGDTKDFVSNSSFYRYTFKVFPSPKTLPDGFEERVTSRQEVGKSCYITLRLKEEEFPLLLEHFLRDGVTIYDIEKKKPSLEEVFLRTAR